MSDKNDYAFPGPNTKDHPQGLTKREFFAALAMQGRLAGRYEIWMSDMRPTVVARDSVRYADALLTELAGVDSEVVDG